MNRCFRPLATALAMLAASAAQADDRAGAQAASACRMGDQFAEAEVHFAAVRMSQVIPVDVHMPDGSRHAFPGGHMKLMVPLA